MIFLIVLTVFLYSGLMVWILAKVGSSAAQSVIDMINRPKKQAEVKHKEKYERLMSAR
nr:hypothetical protein [Thalassobacillus sp. CUG 92003]